MSPNGPLVYQAVECQNRAIDADARLTQSNFLGGRKPSPSTTAILRTRKKQA